MYGTQQCAKNSKKKLRFPFTSHFQSAYQTTIMKINNKKLKQRVNKRLSIYHLLLVEVWSATLFATSDCGEPTASYNMSALPTTKSYYSHILPEAIKKKACSLPGKRGRNSDDQYLCIHWSWLMREDGCHKDQRVSWFFILVILIFFLKKSQKSKVQKINSIQTGF